jgi:hypothetical protein
MESPGIGLAFISPLAITNSVLLTQVLAAKGGIEQWKRALAGYQRCLPEELRHLSGYESKAG